MTLTTPHPLVGGVPAPRPSGERSWRLASPFVLRVAGKPYTVAESLRFPELAAWAGRLLDAEAALGTAGEAAVAALEAAVQRHPEGSAARGSLISLKRDVYNGRAPRPATRAATEGLLDPAAAQLLADWLAARAALAALAADGDGVLAGELTQRRAAVRAAVDDELRSAVLLQSPVLELQLDRYLRAEGKVDKRARKVERTLLEFLYRAAVKTSPFSTLTSVGLGEFAGSGAAGALPAPASLAKRSAVRLNVAVLARVSDAILARPDLRAALEVRTTSGWRAQRGRVRYVRRSAQRGDPNESVTIDSVRESMFLLPSGQALTELLAVLPPGRDATLAAVADALLAADPARRRDDVEAFCGHLVRLGLLVVPGLHVDQHATDPLRAYRASIERVGTGWSAVLAARLGEAERLVAAYPAADARTRRGLLGELREVLAAALRELGGDEAAVPQTLLYEDTAVDPAGLRCDGDAWRRGVVADLSDVADVLPVFDVNLPRRLVTRGFFHARYGVGGTCTDLQTFAHEFQHDFFDHYTQRSMRRQAFDDDGAYVAQENWFHQPEIDALDAARELAARELARAYAALPPGAAELRLDGDFLATLRAATPAVREPLRSWSFFAQLAHSPGGTAPARLVLNRIYTGMTLLFSRFGHCLTAPDGRPAADVLREELAAATPPGVVLAELRGGYGTTNLNLHPAVTPYEIVCPGEVSSRPAGEQLPLDDLSIVDDPAEGRLRLMSRRLGAEVVPVYLGFLMPMALPELQQVLLCFSVTGMAQVDLWAGTGVAEPDGGVLALPRLVAGDVVVQRRQWRIAGDRFPARRPDATDAAFFADVARWRRAHGVPRRVFAAAEGWAAQPDADTQPAADDPGEARPGAGGSRKPLPVDFDSWFSVQLLEQLARGCPRLVLTEALPDADELWLRDEHGREHVCELTFELYAEEEPHRVG